VGRTALLYQERAREMGVERVILDETVSQTDSAYWKKKKPSTET
jgi:hypothetical protein